MSPIAELLFSILAEDLTYNNGKQKMEFKPGSVAALRSWIELLDKAGTQLKDGESPR